MTVEMVWFGVSIALFYGVGHVMGQRAAVRRIRRVIREAQEGLIR